MNRAAALLIGVVFVGVGGAPALAAQDCGAIANLKIENTNLLSATEVLAAGDLPAYCRVLGFVRQELYAELCEFVHPAASSIGYLMSHQSDVWSVHPENEEAYLEMYVEKSRELMSDVLMAAYNHPILILKVLHKFEIFKQIDALRRYRLNEIPLWGKMQRALNR